MKIEPQPNSALRLVNVPVDLDAVASPEGNAAVRERVTRENRAAAELTSSDARWAIAAAAANALEGGTAAVLSPERRRRLVNLAGSLGLRPFDANLIIAIVQDSARSGQGPLGPNVADRLTLIRAPREDEDKAAARAMLVSMLTASALGALLLISMVLWVLR